MTRFAAAPIALAMMCSPMPPTALAAEPDFAAYCAKVRDDDTVRSVPAALVSQLPAAFARLIGTPPGEAGYLERTGNARCLNGKVQVCFTGANLPCSKIQIARNNPGASRWCAANRGTEVPAFATGHDALYSYRCEGGQPRIAGTNWKLDRRGFAAPLWTPLN